MFELSAGGHPKRLATWSRLPRATQAVVMAKYPCGFFLLLSASHRRSCFLSGTAQPVLNARILKLTVRKSFGESLTRLGVREIFGYPMFDAGR